MAKLKIKKGDSVIVTTGNDKDMKKARTVLAVYPDSDKVLVEGVNVVTKHKKPNAENPQGGIEQIEKPIHISNVQIVDPDSKSASRIGYTGTGKDKKRIAKKSGKTV